MTKFIRLLGGFIGIAAIGVGVSISLGSGSDFFINVLGGISLVIIGVYFLNYSITGSTLLFHRK